MIPILPKLYKYYFSENRFWAILKNVAGQSKAGNDIPSDKKYLKLRK